jgi:hypothetical protein
MENDNLFRESGADKFKRMALKVASSLCFQGGVMR